MVFANGVASPVFEAPEASDDKLRSFTIDTTREIRTVRMFMKYGIYYMGIWLQDDEGETIVKEVWLQSGGWTEPQEIPRGQHIIGIKCNVEDEPKGVNHISFLLGEIGKPGVVGQLRFPDRVLYPTYGEF